MRFDLLRRLAAAAGAASITAAAAAGSYPAEVTVPLGSSLPHQGYVSPYGDVSGGIVYDAHGGAHAGYSAVSAGRAIPGRFPIERIPVQYLRYYPAVWYGLPGSTLPVVAPQVHMPTDTTQLGFYYQRVPTWMPVPGMVPPPPIPSQLHTFAPMGYDTTGIVTDGTVTNEQVISVRPLSSEPTHSASGKTFTDPNVVPTPPSGDRLPLSPPPAPASEPNTFVPPSELEQLPAIQPLFPASLDE